MARLLKVTLFCCLIAGRLLAKGKSGQTFQIIVEVFCEIKLNIKVVVSKDKKKFASRIFIRKRFPFKK